MQYNVEYFNVVQCSAVQFSAVQCSIVKGSAVEYNTKEYRTLQTYDTVQWCGGGRDKKQDIVKRGTDMAGSKEWKEGEEGKEEEEGLH